MTNGLADRERLLREVKGATWGLRFVLVMPGLWMIWMSCASFMDLRAGRVTPAVDEGARSALFFLFLALVGAIHYRLGAVAKLIEGALAETTSNR